MAMRNAAMAVTLVYLCTMPAAQAQERGRSWMRRLTLVASCAASLWDVQTTAAAIGRGGRETNGFFTDAQGRAQLGRMIGFKVGLCGGMAVAQESKLAGRRSALKDSLWIGANTGLAARFTMSAIHNLGVPAQPETSGAVMAIGGGLRPKVGE